MWSGPSILKCTAVAKSSNAFFNVLIAAIYKHTEPLTVDWIKTVCTRRKFKVSAFEQLSKDSMIGHYQSSAARVQDDCRALRMVVQHIAQSQGVSAHCLLRPFAFSIDTTMTHAHIAALCESDLGSRTSHVAPTIHTRTLGGASSDRGGFS
jgi:hypothetical protein